MCNQKYSLIEPPRYAQWTPRNRAPRRARIAMESGNGVVVEHDDGKQEYMRFGGPGCVKVLR